MTDLEVTGGGGDGLALDLPCADDGQDVLADPGEAPAAAALGFGGA